MTLYLALRHPDSFRLQQ